MKEDGANYIRGISLGKNSVCQGKEFSDKSLWLWSKTPKPVLQGELLVSKLPSQEGGSCWLARVDLAALDMFEGKAALLDPIERRWNICRGV